MAYRLKGFITIPAFANNLEKQLSPLGELSNKSSTFAIEKGYYAKEQCPNVELVSFTSKHDDREEYVTVPARISDHVITIAQWVFTKSITKSITNNPDTFRNLLLGEYGDVISELELGKMVVANGNWMPSYMAWKLDDGGEDNALRIWFADEAFSAQYDDYQIVVIPPLTPVDIFQKVRSEVVKELEKFNLPEHHDKVTDITKAEPYTLLRTKTYPWHDREDAKAETLPTDWSVAIYGMAGNNPTLIKDAIAKYILANSGFSKEDWLHVFPDIFTSTEFVFVPMWHRRSVPDETARGSLYSPIVPYDEQLTLANKYIKYPVQSHVGKYLSTTMVQFKSLAALVCGGPENRGDKYRFEQMFPDYATLNLSSIEVNRMSKRTVDFTVKLVEAIVAAESMDEYSYIGASLSRVMRDDKTYVGFDFEDTLYMVLSRMSMEEATE